MHMRIFGLGTRIHLLSSFDFGRLVASGEVEPGENDHWDAWSARVFLRRHFRDSYEIGTLRTALAPDVYDLTRLCDEAVIDIAVRYLCQGTWRVGYERVRRADPGGVAGQASTGRPEPQRRSFGVPAFHARSVAARAASPARPAAVAASSEPEWTDDTDQSAFAAVLERAAEQAMPFCEVCAALRAQKVAALE